MRFGRVNAISCVAGRGPFLDLERTACDPERHEV